MKLRQLDMSQTSALSSWSTSTRPRFWRHLGQRIVRGSAHMKTIVDILFYLRRLSEFRFDLDSSSMQRLISASIMLRIDYCNEMLPGLPASKLSLDPLQRVLNASARSRVDAGQS